MQTIINAQHIYHILSPGESQGQTAVFHKDHRIAQEKTMDFVQDTNCKIPVYRLYYRHKGEILKDKAGRGSAKGTSGQKLASLLEDNGR